MMTKKLGVILIVLVFFGTLGYTSAGINYADTKGNQDPAKVYINTLINKLDKLVELGLKHGISLSPQEKEKIEDTKKLLAKASSEVDTNRTMALKMAREAITNMYPIIIKINRQLETKNPEYSHTIKREELFSQLKTRAKIYAELKGTLEKIKAFGVNIPEEIGDRLQTVPDLINSTRKLIIQGNFTGAYKNLKKIDQILLQTNRQVRIIGEEMTRYVALLSHVMRELHNLSLELYKTINVTISQLNMNNTVRAELLLERSIIINEKLIFYLKRSRSINIIPRPLVEENNLYNITLTQLVEIEKDLKHAKEQLHTNNIEDAILYLENALNQLLELKKKIEDKKISNYVRGDWGPLTKGEVASQIVDMLMRRGWTALSIYLDKTIYFLKQAKNQYEAGVISEEKYQFILQKTRQTIEIIKERISDKPHPIYIERKISLILEWISNNTK